MILKLTDHAHPPGFHISHHFRTYVVPRSFGNDTQLKSRTASPMLTSPLPVTSALSGLLSAYVVSHSFGNDTQLNNKTTSPMLTTPSPVTSPGILSIAFQIQVCISVPFALLATAETFQTPAAALVFV